MIIGVSKAAERSSNSKAVGLPLDKQKYYYYFFFMMRRAVSVELLFLYPDCYGLSKSWTWNCSNSCLGKTHSTRFDVKLRPDTG